MRAKAGDCVPALRAAGLREMADWAEARPVRMGGQGRTCRDLWDAAPQGDWLLHYAQRAGAPRPALVRAAAACVRPALRFVRGGEVRPLRAIEAAEAWADHPTTRNRRRAEKAAEVVWVAWMVRAEGATATARAAAVAGWAAAAAARRVAWSVEPWSAGWAAWRAATAHLNVEGSESESAAHAACADEVRRLVPFLDLAGGGRRTGGGPPL